MCVCVCALSEGWRLLSEHRHTVQTKHDALPQDTLTAESSAERSAEKACSLFSIPPLHPCSENKGGVCYLSLDM